MTFHHGHFRTLAVQGTTWGLMAGIASSTLLAVQTEFSLRKKDVVLGESVYVSFFVSNKTGRLVNYSVSPEKEGNFAFKAVESPGGVIELAPYIPTGGLTSERRLLAGQSESIDILLGEYLVFTRPGKYTLECRANFAIFNAEGGIVSSGTTGTLKFTVRQDNVELARIVGELCHKLDSYDERVVAVRELLVMREPVALGCLTRLLADKDARLAEMALMAIGRIDSEGAKQVLDHYTKPIEERLKRQQAEEKLNYESRQKQERKEFSTTNGRRVLGPVDGAVVSVKSISDKLRTTHITLNLQSPMPFEQFLDFVGVKTGCRIMVGQMDHGNSRESWRRSKTCPSLKITMQYDGTNLTVDGKMQNATAEEILNAITAAASMRYLIDDQAVHVLTNQEDIP